MDRNTVTGLLLIGLLWIAMVYYNQNQREKIQETQTTTEEIDQENRDQQIPQKQVEPINAVNEAPIVSEHIPDSITQQALITKYGHFAKFREGQEKNIIVENDKIIVEFSSKGGLIQKVTLKDYKTYGGGPLVLFEDTAKNSFNFEYAHNSGSYYISTKDLFFQTSNSSTIIENEDVEKVVFSVQLDNGQTYEHIYSIPATGYQIDFELKTKGFDQIIPRNSSYLTLDWKQRLPRQENGVADERLNSNIYYRFTDGEVKNLNVRKNNDDRISTKLTWVSFKQKFFNSSLIAQDNFGSGTQLKTTNSENDDFVKDFEAKMIVNYDGSNAFSFPMQFYFGPNQYYALKKQKNDLHKIVPLGKFVFGWVNRGLIIPVFTFLNKYISNYGIIIFILVLLIKLVLTPFTYKSFLSLIKMKVLKPELAEIKEKYGKDQQKLAQKQMELYRKAGVNPMGGCLPMLFQMPILIAMYRFFPSSIELRQQSFLWAKDLSTYDSILDLPFTIPQYGAHVSLFTILMAITSFFYTKMNSSAQPDSGGAMGAQMKMFQYFMPFMLLFIFNKFSAALSYYYFLYNLLSMVQHFLMKKFVIDEDKIHRQLQENKKKPVKKSKWQSRLEQAMKQQQEMQNKKQGKGSKQLPNKKKK